jgi:hypothetical protein
MGPALDVRERAVAPGGPRRPDVGPPAVALPAVVLIGIALRVWRAGHNGASFDESFTAMVGRRPLGEVFEYLRVTDSHPPLDYLLRAPLSRMGVADVWLRAPSVVFSCVALALFAWWMHDRCWFGVIATALFSFSTFQVLHGGEARMYALLQLLGVGAAVVAERWLRRPESWHAWCLGAIVLVALFDHVSGLLLGLGLLVLSGLRTDREAWRVRLALGGAATVWLAAWLPTVVAQLGHEWSSWIPRTTPSRLADVVAEHLVTADGVAWIAFGAVVAGGVLLVRADAVLGRLWLACGVVPFAAAAVIGTVSAFLLARTLTLASWAPVLAVAFLLERARVRGGRGGRITALLVPLFVLLASASFLAFKQWDYDLSIDRLERVVAPGDVVGVRPARYGLLADWRFDVHGDRDTVRVAFDGAGDTDARRVLGAPPTGRTWLLTPVGSPTEFPGYRGCSAPWTDGVTTIVCLRVA